MTFPLLVTTRTNYCYCTCSCSCYCCEKIRNFICRIPILYVKKSYMCNKIYVTKYVMFYKSQNYRTVNSSLRIFKVSLWNSSSWLLDQNLIPYVILYVAYQSINIDTASANKNLSVAYLFPCLCSPIPSVSWLWPSNFLFQCYMGCCQILLCRVAS